MPTRKSAHRAPELIILTATVISALNALAALEIVRLSAVHLAVANIGLACVLGIVARGLVSAEPTNDVAAEGRTQQRERGST